MAEQDSKKLPHLFIVGTASAEKYVPTVMGGKEFQIPARDRNAHGKKLLRQLQKMAREAKA